MQDFSVLSAPSHLNDSHFVTDQDFPLRRSDALRALRPITAPPVTRPRRLRLDQLHLAPEVFSFRQQFEKDYTQKAVVEELSRDLRNGQRLDPIRIVWTSQGWTVTDGYLRLEAYKAVNWDAGIPVTVFNGAPADALDKAIETNRKRSLPLTQTERADVAWFYVSTGRKLSKRETAQQSGVSQRMVAHMRKVRRDLVANGLDAEEFSTWWEARRAALINEEEVEGFDTDRAIQRIRDTLRSQFGKLDFYDVETFACGVKEFAGRRYKELIAVFGELDGAEAYEESRAEALLYSENPDF